MFFRPSGEFLRSLGITAAEGGRGTGLPTVDFRFADFDEISKQQVGKAVFYQEQL